MTLTFEFVTLKTLSAMPTHVMHIFVPSFFFKLTYKSGGIHFHGAASRLSYFIMFA